MILDERLAAGQLPQPAEALFGVAQAVVAGFSAVVVPGINVRQDAVLRAELALARQSAARLQATAEERRAAEIVFAVADAQASALLTSVGQRLAGWPIVHGRRRFLAQAGLLPRPVMLPALVEEREDRLLALHQFLRAGADHGWAGCLMLARASADRLVALRRSRSALAAAVREHGAARADHHAALEALRLSLARLLVELSCHLPPADARWTALGLLAPEAADRLPVPNALTLTPGSAGSGLLFVDWAAVPRATRYRVWVCEGEGFDLAAEVGEASATLRWLPVGQVIAVRVTALNEAGESLPGEEDSIVLP